MISQKAQALKMIYKLNQYQLEGETVSLRTFPHTPFPVVVKEQDQRVIKLMNYSLIPSWSKMRKPKFSTYNARLESICEKPTWKTSVVQRRCLVPLTSFFESCYEGSHAGNIVEFRAKDQKPWTVAGVTSEWLDKDTGEIVESFAIITTQPSDYIEGVGHDRSPLFLHSDHWDDWIEAEFKNCQQATDFLQQSHAPLKDSEVIIERPLKAGWDKK
jgi:putative SOS response-associated peptidase YedK